jgi:hypothetical protein
MANWKIWVPVGAIVLLATLFVIMKRQQAMPVADLGSPAQTVQENDGSAPQPAIPSPVGLSGPAAQPGTPAADIDAAVAAMFANATADQAAVQAEEANLDTAAQNNALGDFGTAYDPTAL